MRHHVVIVSEESVMGGYYRCGVGEVVDTMAMTLRAYFDVTVITPGKYRGGALGGRLCLGVYGEDFYAAAAEVVNAAQPSLVHNFGRPDFINRLTTTCKKVLAFDRWEDVCDQLDHVGKYDHVVTLSNAYAEELKATHPEAVEWPLRGIINGIDGSLYNGRFIDNGDSRKYFYNYHGREDTGKPLFVTTGRLAAVKGTEELIAEASAIASAGADLVVYGEGDKEYEQQLAELHRDGVLIFVPHMADYFEMCSAMSAADFYLTPSIHEVCGLQPMKAARMGCVPIVRPVGGMGENFDATNAILITGSITDAILQAMSLSKDEYSTLRLNAMAGSWTWDTRIRPWVELYGLETAPESESAFKAAPPAKESRVTRSAEVAPIEAPKKKECPFALYGG